MTTPLLPTKSLLSATKYTPKELVDDQALEDWFFETDNNAYIKRLGFIRALMTAYRAGASSVTYTFDFIEETDYLIVKIKEVSPSTNDYKYTVTRSSETSRTFTVAWA